MTQKDRKKADRKEDDDEESKGQDAYGGAGSNLSSSSRRRKITAVVMAPCGVPGMGKTTLFRLLKARFAEQDWQFLIVDADGITGGCMEVGDEVGPFGNEEKKRRLGVHKDEGRQRYLDEAEAAVKHIVDAAKAATVDAVFGLGLDDNHPDAAAAEEAIGFKKLLMDGLKGVEADCKIEVWYLHPAIA